MFLSGQLLRHGIYLVSQLFVVCENAMIGNSTTTHLPCLHGSLKEVASSIDLKPS